MPPGGLTLSDIQAMAWLEASLYVMGSKGLLNKVEGPLTEQVQMCSAWEG